MDNLALITDQRLIPQSPPSQAEGESSKKNPLVWEVQRIVALTPTSSRLITSRERADFWRIAVIISSPVIGDLPRLLITQGLSSAPARAVELGTGGSLRLPMVENNLLIENIGDCNLNVVIIVTGGFDDQYFPGNSLV